VVGATGYTTMKNPKRPNHVLERTAARGVEYVIVVRSEGAGS
jgi:hypothetical protein